MIQATENRQLAAFCEDSVVFGNRATGKKRKELALGMGKCSNNKKQLNRSVVEALEPRLLYSADVLNAVGGALLPNNDEQQTHAELMADLDLFPDQQISKRVEVVFVDSHVPDYAEIINDLSANNNTIDVYVIDADSNGVEQIEQYLQNHSSVDAIHLIAHEQLQGVRLGNLSLNTDNIDQFSAHLSAWGESLSGSADILLYGCNLAASEDGQQFIEKLAHITGADVAASTDNTGSAELGANWTLEHRVGNIETKTPISESVAANWQHILATVTVTTTDDKLNSSYDYTNVSTLIASANADLADGKISLREAIMAANGEADLDIITLPTGQYDLTLSDTKEDNNESGDLDITENLTIDGADVSNTIINSNVDSSGTNDVARVMQTFDAEVTLNNLTIRGGEEDDIGGGGIHTKNGTLELNTVLVTDNKTSNDKHGGGLYLDDTNTTINDSTISFNESAEHGGGIYTSNAVTLTIDGSVINNNTSDKKGGGVYAAHELSATQSSFLFNTSTNESGGGIFSRHNASSTFFADVRIENNKAVNGNGGGAYIEGRLEILKSNFSENSAYRGGGLYHDNTDEAFAINTSTFYKNAAIEDGGGIALDGENATITNSTLASNTAGDTGSAIDSDNGTKAFLENTIVSDNVSSNSSGLANGFRQLDIATVSKGFNLISGAVEVLNYELGDINAAHGSTNVTINLATELSTANGSHSRHLAITAGSDAIDAGAGLATVDGTGLLSNEFVDIGAWEYRSTQDVTKIYWIDETEKAVFRGNQDGSGSQKIRNFPDGLGTTSITDIAYDPITQNVFYAWERDYLGFSYSIAASDKDGRNYDSNPLGLSATNTGVKIEAIAISQNYLYLTTESLEAGNDDTYFTRYEIVTEPDGTIEFDSFATPMVTDTLTSEEDIETMDASLTFGVTSAEASNEFIIWGDKGADPIPDYASTIVGTNTVSPTFNVNNASQPSNDPQGVSLDNNNYILYGVQDFSIFSMPLDRSDPANLVWDLAAANNVTYADGFTDVHYDSNNDTIWYTTPNGKIGYVLPSLDSQTTVFDAGVSLPSALSLASITAVNAIPTPVTGKTAFSIEEGGTLAITQSHLETTDTETAASGIIYTVSAQPSFGKLYLTTSPTEQVNTFTQEDINSDRLIYEHFGEEPVTDSFEYTVSDDLHTLATNSFSINVTQVNDTPTANTISDFPALTEQTSFSYSIPASAFSDPENGTLTYQVSLGNGDPLPAWISFDGNQTISGTPDDAAANASVADRTLRITATDPDGAESDPITVVMSITNINNAPSTINASTLSLNENTSGTVSVGSFTTNDLDQADTHSYSVDDSRFSFNGNVLELLAAESINFELEPEIVVNVTSTDNGVGTLDKTQQFTITVNNINDLPVATQTTLSDSTNELDNFTYVVSNTLFTDEDTSDTITVIAFLDDGTAPGTAIPGSHWLQFNQSTNTFSGQAQDADVGDTKLILVATDNAGAQSAQVNLTITVNDINQAPNVPTFTNSIINENSYGDYAGYATGSDPDASDPPNTLTYSVDDSRFIFYAGTLQLRPLELLDYETEPTVDLTITVEDDSGATNTRDITLTVANLNDPPVAATSQLSASTNELDNFSYSVSGTLFSDADAGDTLTINAYLDDGSPSGAAIPASLWIQYDQATNTFSGQPQATDVGDTKLLLIAEDGSGAQSSPVRLNVSVANINQQPNAPSMNLSPVDENTEGAYVGIATATDPDPTDTLSYTVDDSRFVFNGNTLSLNPNESINYENEQSVDLTITATDNHGLSNSTSYTVNIVDLNDVPTSTGALPTQYTSEANVFNYTVPNSTFEDQDGDQLTLSATQSDGSALPSWLNFDSANNTFSGTPGDSDTGTLNLDIVATDTSGAISTASSLSISIGNTNQAPTNINLSANVLAENSTTAVIGNLSVEDPDAGDSHTFSVNDSRFRIVNGVLEYFSSNAINFETEATSPTVTIEVTAYDSANAPVTESFVINLQDEDDAPTGPSTLPQQTATETQAFSYSIPGNTFTDEDGDPISYTATLSNGDALPAWLTFNASNQTFSGTPNDDDTGQLDIVVTASSTNNGITTGIQSSLQLNVADINQAPTVLAIAPNAINENTDSEVVGLVNVVDPDSADTNNHTFTVSDSRFHVTNGSLQLKPGELLDFETEPSSPIIQMQVTAEDPSGETISTTVDVMINDLNDAPTGPATLPLQTASDAEPLLYQIPDGTFTDQDGNPIVLDANLIDGSALPSWLNFDNTTNTFSGQPNEADQGIYQIQINAFDGTANSLAKTAIIVNVSDVNLKPTAINLDNNSVAENDAGAVIGTLTTSDPDANDTHQYSVNDARFQITGNELSLSPSVTLNHEQDQNIAIDISSTDNHGETLTETLVISIGNENDAPVATAPINNIKINEDEPFSLTIPSDAFSDEDSNDILSYLVTLADDSDLPDWLNFDALSNTISGTPGNEHVGSLSLKVVAVDNAGSASDAQEFAINIANINDPPEILSLSNDTVQEDTLGAVVGQIVARDIDIGSSMNFVVNDDRFHVVDGVLSLKDDQSINFEPEPSVTLTITVTDEFAASSSSEFIINVIDTNERPIAQFSTQTVETPIDQALDISMFEFVDPENENVTINVVLSNGEPLPVWLVHDPDNQTISFNNAPADVTSIDINLVATDDRGASSEQALTIMVADEPVLAAAIEPLPEPEIPTPATTSEPASKGSSNNDEENTEEQDSNEGDNKPTLNNALPDTQSIEVASVDLGHLIKPLDVLQLIDLKNQSTQYSSTATTLGISSLNVDPVDVFQLNLQSTFENTQTIEFRELASVFDRQKQETSEALASETRLIASSFTFTSGLSVGYLLWLIRGGTIIGSVLSSLPAWRLVDPLPILGTLGDDYDEDDESLESMVENKPQDDHKGKSDERISPTV